MKTYFKADKWLLTALAICVLTQATVLFWHRPIFHTLCSVKADSEILSLFGKMGFKEAELCGLRGQLWIASGLFIFLSFVFFLRMLLRPQRTWDFKFKYLKLKDFLTRKRNTFLLGLNLSVLFYIIYLCAGFAWRHSLIEGRLGIFGADETDPFSWTHFSRDANFDYHHKAVHPLLLLIEVPLGVLLHSFSLPEDVAAFLINSFFASLSVGMAFFCFFLITQSHLHAVLWSVFYGFTTSQLVFGSVPEVYSLGACSIILSYLLLLICRSKKKLYFELWVLAGILSFGITTINFSHTLLAFIAACIVNKKKDSLLIAFELIGTVIFCVFLLSWVQKWIFPAATFFFSPDDILRNNQLWKEHLSLSEPGLFMSECVKIFFLISFVAPLPHHMLSQSGELSFFMSTLKYSLLGGIGAFLWAAILAGGVIRNRMKKNPVFWFIIGSILFNALFHMYYNGPEAFLYSPHIIFPIILLAAFGTDLTNRYMKMIFAAAVIFIGINNVLIMDKIIFPKEEFPIVKNLPYACHRESALFR